MAADDASDRLPEIFSISPDRDAAIERAAPKFLLLSCYFIRADSRCSLPLLLYRRETRIRLPALFAFASLSATIYHRQPA